MKPPRYQNQFANRGDIEETVSRLLRANMLCSEKKHCQVLAGKGF